MKKLVLSVAVVLAGLAVASAQGTIKFYNIGSSYLVSTNGTGTGVGQNGTTTGLMDKTANSYYFALLMSSAAPTSSNPLTGGWTVAQTGGVNLVGNNYTLIAGGITGNGGANGVAVDGWAAGSTKYVELVGWSASLGTTWSQITSQLSTGWTSAGYYGVSSTGQVASGGVGTPASPAAALFGSTGQIASGWMLSGVSPVPEPTTLALVALGGASLLLIRRRK